MNQEPETDSQHSFVDSQASSDPAPVTEVPTTAAEASSAPGTPPPVVSMTWRGPRLPRFRRSKNLSTEMPPPATGQDESSSSPSAIEAAPPPARSANESSSSPSAIQVASVSARPAPDPNAPPPIVQVRWHKPPRREQPVTPAVAPAQVIGQPTAPVIGRPAAPRFTVTRPRLQAGDLAQSLPRLPLLGFAALFVALAQVSFLGNLEFSWAGLVFTLLGIAAFMLASIGLPLPFDHVQPSTGLDPAVSRLPVRGWRLGALALSALLVIWLLTVLAGQDMADNNNLNWTLLIWLAAIGLYLLAVIPLHRPQVDWAIWWSAHRWLVLAVVVIMLVAFALRVWNVGGIPPTLAGDEATQGLESVRVVKGDLRNPFITGQLSVPTLAFYFNAPSIALLGNTMLGLRLPWALLGTTTVLVFFGLVTQLTGPILGLVAAALLATYHFHIHFSRLGAVQVADTFFVSTALLFLYRAYDRRQPLDWAICGLAIGFSQYFYAGARFTAVIVVAVLALFVLRDGLRFLREQRWGILILVGAALISGAPMIQYAIRFPDEYNARVNQIGIIQSGWLANEQVVRHEGAIPILIDQLQRSALAFNAYPDRTSWYGNPGPLFDFAWGALFLLGLGYATLHLFNRRLFPMTAWWWGAMIMGGVLTESPPSSQRLVTMGPPAVFMVALALVQGAQIARAAWPGLTRRQLAPALGAAVLILALLSIKWYFVDFTPLRVYGNFDAVTATALGEYAHTSLGPDWRLYFFGPPRMFVDFPTVPYLAPEVEGKNIEQPVTPVTAERLVLPDKNAAFVFLPERRNELSIVRQQYPNGAVTEIPAPNGGDPLLIIYQVPRDQLGQGS